MSDSHIGRQLQDQPGLWRRRPWVVCCWLAVAGSLILVQYIYAGPQDARLWMTAFDAGHAFLFGMISVAILHLWRLRSQRERHLPGEEYLLTLVTAVAVGGLTELVQLRGSRHADLHDFLRDCLGSVAGLLVFSALDKRTHWRFRHGLAHRAGRLLLAAALLALAFAELGDLAVAYLQRNAAFPRICDFEARWETRFLTTTDAVLTTVEPPADWNRRPGNAAARLLFLPAAYPSLSITEPCSDWTGYDRLVFEAYSEPPDSIVLVLRINDRNHNNAYSDRFNRVFTIRPGGNSFVVPLSQVADAPQGRAMDLKQVQNVTLFAVRPSTPRAVFLDAFRLEAQ